MATTEPVESPVQSEETSKKTSPVKEVKQNGKDGESTTESPATPEKTVDTKGDAEAVDNHQEEGEEEEEEQDEADDGVKPEKAAEKDDDTEKEESSDDEPQKGSLDGPVEIMTGKRERKKVERLTMQSPPEKEKEKREIKDGRGIKLGDCPMVEYQLGRNNAEVLKPLYRVLFGRVGKISEIKKHIRKFSGFPFTKEDSIEYEKKEVQLNRFTLGGLKELCTWLNLEKSGTKEEIIQRIIEYCLTPVMSIKKPPVKRKKGSKKGGKKKKKSNEKEDGQGDGEKKKRSHKKKQKIAVEDGDEDEEDAMADEDDEDEEDEDDDIAEDLDEDSDVEEEPKKKKAKKETPKSAKKTKAKTTPKRTSPKKSPTKKRSSLKIIDSDGESSDDDAPLVKKSDSPPTEDEMRTFIQNFLDGANLEQVTMKTVCKKVYETYPDFDLTHKKDFIKSTVKQIIST